MSEAKPYSIPKKAVWEAYKRVKANQGAAGVDTETITEFERKLKDNLYKLWNRMSSGSYFPQPVRAVAIPKKNGGQRILGVPAVSDRVAQTVVKMYLEPLVERVFHPDSYGCRPGRSAVQALAVTRQRCWRYDWVIDLDIKGMSDNLSRELMMRAVRWHTDCPWVLLYLERWLNAPIQREDGTLEHREKGTPQGSVVSPILANLFMHYAFDEWMKRGHPQTPFERYMDDCVVHCRSEEEAVLVRAAIEKRLAECGLEVHPEKTRIVYCKDDYRRRSFIHETFDFLGYTFRARRSKNRWGKYFINFSPAISNKAAKAVRHEMRGWKLARRSDKTLEDLSRMFNPIIRGWINYYGCYYKSALYPTLTHLNRWLARWATGKYKKFRRHRRRAMHWLGQIARRQPELFAHWQMGLRPTVGS